MPITELFDTTDRYYEREMWWVKALDALEDDDAVALEAAFSSAKEALPTEKVRKIARSGDVLYYRFARIDLAESAERTFVEGRTTRSRCGTRLRGLVAVEGDTIAHLALRNGRSAAVVRTAMLMEDQDLAVRNSQGVLAHEMPEFKSYNSKALGVGSIILPKVEVGGESSLSGPKLDPKVVEGALAHLGLGF